MSLSRLLSSLSFRLQGITIFLSLVGVGYGIKSYLHIKEAFGEEQSLVFYNDLIGQIAVAILLNVLAAWIIYKIVTEPVKKLGAVMLSLSQGSLEVEVPYTQQSTEIGCMARLVKIFKQNAIDKQRLEEEQGQTEARAKTEKKKTMENLATHFETSVQGIVNSVVTNANDLAGVSKTMTDLVSNVSDRAGNVAMAADGTLMSLKHVAASVEDMSLASGEIAREMDEAATAVSMTVQESEKTFKISENLSQASERISDIVKIIQQIADQINLLSLNATIEAARAGEAGKGFAVVANEVKNLANQTKTATVDITEHIENIRQVSSDVIAAMGSIKNSIGRVDNSSKIVKMALTEQQKMTSEISTNMSDASSQTDLIVKDIKTVTEASIEAKRSAEELLQSVHMLSREGGKLGDEVTTFTHEIVRG